MSKAFTKESDGTGDATLPGHARAPLPSGAPNYVTSRGLELLRQEHAALEREREAADAAHTAALTIRITEVAARIGSAVVVEPPTEGDEIRFGATVTVREAKGHERRVRIVGVDEANAADGRVAFVAPIARALLGRRTGETAIVRTPKGEDEVEIVAVAYERE